VDAFFTLKTMTMMASLRTALHLLPLEVFVDLIHWFERNFIFGKHFCQWIL